MLEVVVVALSLANGPGMLVVGDTGGSGGGAIFCETRREAAVEGCRGLKGEGGTELRSGAIWEMTLGDVCYGYSLQPTLIWLCFMAYMTADVNWYSRLF